MKTNNIFITGGNGFIGRHLSEEFKDPNLRLFILILPSEKPQIEDHRIIWVSGELNNPETYIEAMSHCSIVIHMAAELHDPQRFEMINIKGVENIISAARSCEIERFIHLSSVGVVGMQFSITDVVVDENAECKPKNEYERTKLISERLLHAGFSKEKLVILRPTNVFGDLHPRQHLLSLIRHISSGKMLFMSCKAKVNYVYVKDVAATIAYFSSHPELSGTFNIGEPMLMTTFISKVAQACGLKGKIVKTSPFFIRLILVFKKIIPASIVLKLLSLFNRVSYSGESLKRHFTLPYGVEYGLKKTVDYYRKNGQLND